MATGNYSDYTIGLATKNADRFVDASKNPSWFTWLFSMGTSVECYKGYLEELGDIQKYNNNISVVRTIIYALAKPLQSQFFYWTLLLLILHKFNFRKPVMKIILAHYILRAIGDILEQLSGLMSRYYAPDPNDLTKCANDASAEKHPLRWFLTRQVGMIFWYFGEICGDWYPLLRTRAVARDQKSMYYVYVACGMFNLSKIVMIINHFTFSVSNLYTKEGTFNVEANDKFYFRYWIIEAVIIITSLIYDMTVYFVLKKQIFNRTKSDFGFLKKFRSISEYRIIVSVVICVTLLPAVLVAVGLKIVYMYKGMPGLDFSFEDIRLLIINVQYYMIFIDQIMLFRSRDGTSIGETTSINTSPYNNNFSSGTYNNFSGATYNNLSSNNLSNNSNPYAKPLSIDSKLYYSNLNNGSTLNASQNTLLQYSYANSNNSNSNINYGRLKSSNRGNTLATYDEYINPTNDWNYLRK